MRFLCADTLRTNSKFFLGCPSKSLKIGAPERSRTPNPQIRSLVLYPIELRARAEQRSRLYGLQIATPAGRGKQGGSKGRSESVLHSDIPTRELPNSYRKHLGRRRERPSERGDPRAD
jgi:hypothetical protein